MAAMATGTYGGACCRPLAPTLSTKRRRRKRGVQGVQRQQGLAVAQQRGEIAATCRRGFFLRRVRAQRTRGRKWSSGAAVQQSWSSSCTACSFSVHFHC